MQEFLLCGTGEIWYYNGILPRDVNNHVPYDINSDNFCKINTCGIDDYDNAIVTWDYHNHKLVT